MTAWLTWDASLASWAAFAAVAVAGATAAWHYARAGGFGWPGAMRAAAVVLLAVTTLRPTLKYDLPTNVARPLRVLVDHSTSMTIPDWRPAGEWLRVAEALGAYLPPDTRPLREAERARAAIETLRQAEQRLATARKSDPAATLERVRLDSARQAAVTVVHGLADAAGETAADAIAAVEQALENGPDTATAARRLDAAFPTLRRASDAADEDLVATDDDAAAAVDRLDGSSRFALAVNAVGRLRRLGTLRAVTLEGRPLDEARTTPGVPSTPLSAALRDAATRAAAAGEEAVVLLSDGRSTEPRSLLAQAAATGVPVYPIAVAPEDRSPDVRLVRLDTPPAVLAGQDVLVRVRMTQRNLDGRPVRVTLTDGTRTIVRDAPAGNDVTVSMNWPRAAAPRLDLKARAEPLVGERRITNNTLSTSVGVIDRRVRVRVVSGSPSSRDTEELSAAVSAVPWADASRGATAPFDADVIVLSDLTPELLNDAAWADLGRAVRERGASLLVLAGRGDWLRDASTAARLAPLLPTTSGPQPAWVTPPQPVWPVPTRAGVDVPYLRTDESADASFRSWLGRPRLSRVLSLGPPAGRARTLLSDRVTHLPVLIDAAVGGGRSAAVMTDEVWRWSTAPDAAEASRQFWTGLVQSMVDLPYAATGDGLQLSIDRPSPVAGRTFFARVRSTDLSASVSIVVTKARVPVATPPLREALTGGGRFVAPLNLPAGTFDVTVRQGGRTLSTTVTTGEDEPAEMLDTSADLAQLKRIADATGGAMLMLEELDQLPDVLALRREREPRIGTYALWASPWWFLTVVACLGLEWALRPRAGLA